MENSPAYHIFVFKVFIGILKDYPAEVLGDLGAHFEAFSTKALGFITHILRPDGTLPPIGDTEQLPTSDSYRQMFGHTQAYQHFLYAQSQGKLGQRPDTVNRVYPNSGYAIFRDQWPDSLRYDTAFHLVAKVGCSSRYHHQGDEGHISLYAEGEDWLIDSGLYNYINDDPVRKYMRGRGGHNVPIISEATYPQKFEQRLKAWRVLDFSDADVNPFLSMELDVLESVRHVRRLEFFTFSKRLVVVDKFDFSDGQLHDVMLQWHIPCDKDLEVEVSRVFIKSKSGKSCSLTFAVVQPDEISVAKGRKGDKVFSCLSIKANEVVDTQVIRVGFNNKSDFEVVSIFDFDVGAGLADKYGDSVVFDVVADCSSYKVVLPDFESDYIQKFVSEKREPYEFPMLRAMALGLGAKDLILDVGANIGNHTLFFSCVLGARVWAFEPNLRLSQPLEKSVELNSVSHLVRVFPVGVGAEPGRAVLDRIDEKNLGAQSLDLSQGEGGDIEVIRLDDLDFDSPVSAIKIDVEGMELAVLHGAERLIRRDRPLLVIESSDVLHFDALESFIKSNGYVYCSSFNGTPTHFFIHQERLLGSPWLDLYFDKGREFYRMRHLHKKLNKAVQLLGKLGHKI